MTRAMSSVATTSHGVRVLGSTCWREHAPVLAAERDRGLHVLALADREHLAAHHPGVDHPRRHPDDDDDVAQARPQHPDHRDREQDEREGELDVGQAHQEVVHPPAEVAGHEPDEHAEDARDQHRGQPDHERDARAEDRCAPGCRGPGDRCRAGARAPAASCQPGSRSRWPMSCSSGSKGATSGAKAAASSTPTTTSSPKSAVRRRTRRRSSVDPLAFRRAPMGRRAARRPQLATDGGSAAISGTGCADRGRCRSRRPGSSRSRTCSRAGRPPPAPPGSRG